MIQNAPHLHIDLILKMFNKILILGHVPKEWCCGLITPIYKKGSKLDSDNYRGICVMKALLKVLCLIMNQRLQAFLFAIHLGKLQKSHDFSMISHSNPQYRFRFGSST